MSDGPGTFSRSKSLYIAAVAGLFLILACELWLSIARLSQTVDEGAHLYAGYQYWKAGDYGLNPEHPPLLKFIAAIPLLPMQLQQPHPPTTFGSKGEEYIGGGLLLYGNDAERILLRARMSASVLSFFLAACIFAAGYEMFGAVTALLALLLCVFEPNLLAHGALVTTDMAATSTIFAAVYALYRYVKKPTIARMLVLGLALGVAAIAKFSAAALLPIIVVCVLAETLRERLQKSAPLEHPPLALFLRRSLGCLVAVLMAWAVIWGIYGFRYVARPGSLQLVPTLAQYAVQLHSVWQAHFILWLAKHHLLPEAYLYGLVDMQVFGSHLSSFLFGKVRQGPTLPYFPMAFLMKSTLPVLLLVAALPFLRFRGGRPWREIIFLAIPAVVFMGVSLLALQNIGVRHILPIFPFVLLLAALGASTLAQRSRAGAYAVGALLLVHVVSSVHTFPNYIAYGNEAIGGSSRTYRVLSDSNVDWGQSLIEVRSYLKKNHVTDCWFVALGGETFSHASYYQIPCMPLPSSFEKLVGAPLPVIPETVHGTLLVSGTEASGIFTGPGPLNPYGEVLQRTPDAMIGDCILVFHGDFHLPLAAADGHASAAYALLQAGKVQEALAEAQTAVTLAPNAPDMQATLGMVLLKMGRPEEAQQAFQNARRLAQTVDPDNWLKTDEMIASIQPAH
jgi:4-amino-4-deoxy-L-arabinose transferase-like glycosyltransferase